MKPNIEPSRQGWVLKGKKEDLKFASYYELIVAYDGMGKRKQKEYGRLKDIKD